MSDQLKFGKFRILLLVVSAAVLLPIPYAIWESDACRKSAWEGIAWPSSNAPRWVYGPNFGDCMVSRDGGETWINVWRDK